MFCTKCGNKAPEGSRFCRTCGNAIEQQAQTPQEQAPQEQAPQPQAPQAQAPQPQLLQPPQPQPPQKEGKKSFSGLLLSAVAVVFFCMGIGAYFVLTMLSGNPTETVHLADTSSANSDSEDIGDEPYLLDEEPSADNEEYYIGEEPLFSVENPVTQEETDVNGDNPTAIENSLLFPTPSDEPAPTPNLRESADPIVINLYSFTDELPRMAALYAEMNPDFAARYIINPTIIPTDGGAYQAYLDWALRDGNVDLFAVEASFALKYTQGDMSDFAMPYSNLGISNLMPRIAAADIAQYTVDIGTRNRDVVGLAYQQTGGALIYRRSLARQVWGTDDPTAILLKLTLGWNRFLEAAAELDAHGISITPGIGDVWQAVRNTGGPWIVNNRIDIHPDRMEMFDIAKELYQNDWTNDSPTWSGAWFAAMAGDSWDEERPVFSYLGPAWLINYVMASNAGETFGDWAITVPPVGFIWGGTWVIPASNMNPQAMEGVRELIEWITLDTSTSGLQHHWAAGTLFDSQGTKDTVASFAVMARTDGRIPFLGGQDMFDIFSLAGLYVNGTVFTQYDEQINDWFFNDAVMPYARGDMTRNEAIEHFLLLTENNLGIR